MFDPHPQDLNGTYSVSAHPFPYLQSGNLKRSIGPFHSGLLKRFETWFEASKAYVSPGTLR